LPCDYSKYPKDWKAIRARILERAGHCCEECGLPNYAVYRWDSKGRWECVGGNLYLDTMEYTRSYKEAREIADHYRDWCDEDYWRVCVLTISHTDHDVANNADSNLRALCQRCHIHHDAQHHAENTAATRRRKNPTTLCLFD
jgi:5-methylcytosine-specific restriction endonuclease McrA